MSISGGNYRWKQDRALAALDALLAENSRLREEIRIREESQIPVIPHGAAVQLERLRVENERLREALAWISDPSYVGNYYPDSEVIEVHRKWAKHALKGGEQSAS